MKNTVSLELTGRFESAFGLLAKNTLPRVVTINPYRFDTYPSADPNFENVTLDFQNENQEATSLKFARFPFAKGGGSGSLEDIVAPPPLLTFSRNKSFITDSGNELETDIIERWNTKSWSIKMRGLLIDMNNHHYPSDIVRALKKLFDYNGVIDVTGTQFLEKDISYIYFTDVDFEPVPEFGDTVQYTLMARSIQEVGFTLLNPNS